MKITAAAALTLALASTQVGAQAMCADGSFVDKGPCQMCPNGRYIGAGGRCQMTPNGDFVRGDDKSSPRLTPNGSFVSGTSKQTTLCPDGTYVAGRRCVLAPNGKYVGGN